MGTNRKRPQNSKIASIRVKCCAFALKDLILFWSSSTTSLSAISSKGKTSLPESLHSHNISPTDVASPLHIEMSTLSLKIRSPTLTITSVKYQALSKC